MTDIEEKYFITQELTHRKELILHLLEYSNHLIVVQGEGESGKTTLFNQLNNISESDLIIRKIAAVSKLSKTDLLKLILDEKDQSVDIDDYVNWLNRCHSKQQIPALLIDDIDLFADEILDFIFNQLAISESQARLHICIFCKPIFLDNKYIKDIETSGNRSTHTVEMPKFNDKQTLQFLKQTYPEENETVKVLDVETIQQIYRLSNGLPGRIIELAEQYLNDPAEKKPGSMLLNIVPFISFLKQNRSIIIVISLLLILSTSVTLLLHKTDSPVQKEEIQIALPPKDMNETQLVNLSLPELINEDESSELQAEPTDIEELTQPVIPELAADVELGRVEKNRKIEIFEDENVPPTNVLDSETNKQNDLVAISKSADQQAENIKSVNTVGKADTVATDSPDIQSTKEVNQQEIIMKRDMTWLLMQESSDYVIQLIGAKEAATIDVYLDKLEEQKENIIQINTTNSGQPWHILVYGHYPDRQQALFAIDKLPMEAKKLSPWPRSIESLKQLEIRNQ